MSLTNNFEWNYQKPAKIAPNSLHIEVIADYGGSYTTDHAFMEVRNHFFRFDKLNKIKVVTDHPVYAFSTIETGFWIAQDSLHSEHKNLVVFSNTAPRGDIKWIGENRQPFVCGILDNGIPVFAVYAGYNLSYIRDRLKGLWIVKVPNKGTQFRSRDYYPEATMAILNGDLNRLGKPIDIGKIPDVPQFAIASVDGYGNLKTTIRKSNLSSQVVNSSIVRIGVNNNYHFALNTVGRGVKGKVGDLCLVSGSSGGKGKNYLEIIKLQMKASKEFSIDGPRDDLGKIQISSVKT
ncbi:hypothetical protein A3D05_04075 [Candidatus Gottesmanbacteria bacterium RIFCSPHIGHO2_02_FULL_40_24]|uniref:Uncharacterized protein n=1 Tax=Candidatus Gottesmanbacteria bacterium RIFCSPHIGHO2_01_FULL_40_15 TaxID=1798376 RepID=A0A1F5Z0U4_9BACT|nr:MAG: hypothetical protein A2777_00865 [Candidatus Gottesmanbacteria bacterium RIFCSPHIGHO2_01_FULL_40_15]OGG17483.1 MAG: hypothetical protein A3D05_04075 [Candidatus Gottesmanbacteria bacterium RIFCSPHIGHO2_02_FULL_40_24]OGG21512.1 MAG: hypothetical protein A3B48_01835 [Candidatus Gottesmanbacteria bacterium RIFCSPLOWO2_01_FULL_40_10]OGG25126.1 MAG: hypothetical protein A3E42_00990 [Candidatus Gottesmanbacteria bacterium RIFCSPHIGHO2_12_FULL_40_13]OGG32753.1 MAG: hypothetical protein A3I80_0